jgi:hypothetical protein
MQPVPRVPQLISYTEAIDALFRAKLTNSQRLLYLLLCRLANHRGEHTQTIHFDSLVRLLGKPDKAVRRDLDLLAERGWLTGSIDGGQLVYTLRRNEMLSPATVEYR